MGTQKQKKAVESLPPKWCYVVFEHQKDARGFIPSVVFEAASGHYPLTETEEYSTLYWGRDFTAA